MVQSAERLGKAVYVLRKNSVPQIRQFFRAYTRASAEEDIEVANK